MIIYLNLLKPVGYIFMTENLPDMWVFMWGDYVTVLQPNNVRKGVANSFNS